MRSSRLVRETLQYFVEDVGCGEKGPLLSLLCSNHANEFTVCPFEP